MADNTKINQYVSVPSGVPKLVSSGKGRKVRSVNNSDEKKPWERCRVLRLQYRNITKGVTVQVVVHIFILSSKWNKEWNAIPCGRFHMSQNKEMGNHGDTRVTELGQVVE